MEYTDGIKRSFADIRTACRGRLIEYAYSLKLLLGYQNGIYGLHKAVVCGIYGRHVAVVCGIYGRHTAVVCGYTDGMSRSFIRICIQLEIIAWLPKNGYRVQVLLLPCSCYQWLSYYVAFISGSVIIGLLSVALLLCGFYQWLSYYVAVITGSLIMWLLSVALLL